MEGPWRWAATDAHISRVLAGANAEAFHKLEGFVTAKFRDRAALQLKSGGVMPAYTAGSYTRQSNPF